MAIALNKPIQWTTAAGDTLTMLDDLQPNIIKPHTRDVLTVLFLQFATQAAAKSVLANLAAARVAGKPLLKSAIAHLREVAAFKQNGRKGTPYLGIGLTAPGYGKIGTPPAKRPADARFQAGMKAAQLGDPPVARWDRAYQGEIHAVVLVGDSTAAPHDRALAKVRSVIAAVSGVTVLGEERGLGLHNANGDGIEHFGYVDGRSQPLFLQEEVDGERSGSDGTSVWDPAFAPSRAILADPAAPNPATQFGSYFVFRKLEQNVKRFKGEEEKLARRLGLQGDDAERAGAMLVGRFEDGTPVTAQFAAGAHHPVPNNFGYDSDPSGGKCPHFAHIRKVNPRGTGGFEPVEDERLHIMARRGQTYGVRVDNPNDGKLANKPEGDVGLLFMAFNADIGQQFEFAQRTWANNAGFPRVQPGQGQPGLDPVIGQGVRPQAEFPREWGVDATVAGATRLSAQVPEAVTMKGGEYFFMPSLSYLRNPA